MTPTREGSFRLFRLAGIDVYLHWSWFLIAIFQISSRANVYSSVSWKALEYLSLFVIVLMHEFGHSLACRQVGGQADQIVLWPLGGVAYVNPPQRPGPTLWSIAAGPLVNVVLVPVFFLLNSLSSTLGWAIARPDLAKFLHILQIINFSLLFFNLLPIYPLDGGQILRALLWFVLGRARSLMVASVLGLIGVVGSMVAIFWIAKASGTRASIWFIVLGIFILMNCWRGFMQARALLRLDKAPRHDEMRCPNCASSPVKGDFWVCGKCENAFDIFDTHGTCPKCGAQFATAGCMECGKQFPIQEWMAPRVLPPKLNRP